MGPARLEAMLAETPGAWSSKQLIERFGREALRRAARKGTAIRILPAVYCGVPWTRRFVTRLEAVSLWCPNLGAVGGLAAAHHHGLVADAPDRITLTLPRHSRVITPEWVRVRRFAIAMPVKRIRGIRVVTVADALIQSWAELPRGAGLGMILDAVRQERVAVHTLRARLAAYPRVRGRRELDRLLIALRRGLDSYLEYVASTRVFNTKEFREFERQVQVRAMGRRYVLDMFHRRARVAVEFDGRKFHSDDAARRRDLERDANLAAEGIVTLRFTYEDIMSRPQWCRDRVRRTIAPRLFD